MDNAILAKFETARSVVTLQRTDRGFYLVFVGGESKIDTDKIEKAEREFQHRCKIALEDVTMVLPNVVSIPIKGLSKSSRNISIKVNRYDFNRNEFHGVDCATGESVLFDPFVGAAIPLSDAEYESKYIAESLIGHTFTMDKACILSGGVYAPGDYYPFRSETWERP